MPANGSNTPSTSPPPPRTSSALASPPPRPAESSTSKSTGSNVSAELSTPNTGGWQTYANVNAAAIPLTVGQHVLRLSLDAVGTNNSVGNFNYITIAPPTSPPVSPPPPPPPPTITQTPFGGTAPVISSIPVTIQAEDFDNGGEGVAYHDLDAANLGGAYRTTEGVDIQPTTDTGGGYNVGYTKAGEWIEYTINVQTPGSYDLSFRLASTGSNGKFHAEIDGANVTGSLTVPNTGGYQSWTTITKTGLPLAPAPMSSASPWTPTAPTAPSATSTT